MGDGQPPNVAVGEGVPGQVPPVRHRRSGIDVVGEKHLEARLLDSQGDPSGSAKEIDGGEVRWIAGGGNPLVTPPIRHVC